MSTNGSRLGTPFKTKNDLRKLSIASKRGGILICDPFQCRHKSNPRSALKPACNSAPNRRCSASGLIASAIDASDEARRQAPSSTFQGRHE